MENKKPEIVYSEPVREIMGKPPRVILRYGTALIFLVFILVVIFSWYFRYPDLVQSPVEITTENPPVTLVSKGTYKIRHLYIKDGEKVAKEQLLGVMETVASIDDERSLRQFTDTCKSIYSIQISRMPELTELGELQNYYGTFRKCIADLNNFLRNDYYGNRIKTVKDELAGLKRYTAQLVEKEKILSENFSLEKGSFRRDSLLNKVQSIADADFEKSKKALNSQQIELKDVQLEFSAKIIDQAGRQQLINELSVTRDEEKDKLISAGDEAFNNLKAQLRIWENNYLLISPVGGRVAFTKYWSENQIVNTDEPVLSIVPADPGNFVGRIYLKMQSSGKVETGQTVNIKLSGFPYLEYGMVRGKIRSKSLVPSGDAYVIEVELPDELTTLYNKKLIFTQNMQGTAEIITNDRSLLVKIISPLRYLFSKNRR
ncbi:MAG: HlyD family efflux transporter periplasmic adaptor subunit [Bacteroidales bacterium]|jgi:HlyD family secretion protein